MNITKHKRLLFIPFSASENNFSLYMRALNWRLVLRQNHREDEMPEIVMYRRPDETDEDYTGYDGVQFAFNEQNVPPGTQIYLLSDGNGDNEFIGNLSFLDRNEEGYALPMSLVAKRAQDIGLTPQLAKNVDVLKLYICNDNSQSTHDLALKLGQTLGQDYAQLMLGYYTSLIFTPFEKTGSKKAVLFFSLPSQNIFIEAGKARDHQKKLSVADTLNAPAQTESPLALEVLMLNRAIQNKNMRTPGMGPTRLHP